MTPYRPRAAVPPELLEREDFRRACAEHDFRVVFLLAHAYGVSYSAIAECTGIKPDRVGLIARGRIRTTSFEKIAQIADGMRIPGHMLGLASRAWERDIAPALPAASRLSPLLDEIATVEIPARIAREDIDDVWSSVLFVESWDHARGGGGMARAAIASQVLYATSLLGADCDSRLRPGLFSAVGSLVLKAGFTSFDVFDHGEAAKRYRFALACAEEVDDWHLRAGVLARLARQAFWLGDLQGALTHVEMALVRGDRLTATERSMLYALRARVFASMGQAQETLASIGRADEEFTHARPEDDPVIVAHFDAAEHAGETGHALADIATPEHHWQQAAERLSQASNRHGTAYARSRAFCDFRRTALLLSLGQIEEAAETGLEAVEKATPVRSHRLSIDARRVLDATDPYSDVPIITDLRGRFSPLAT